METLILLVILGIVVNIFSLDFRSKEETKKEPELYSDIYYRIKKDNTGWPSYKDVYQGIIYTLVPYHEKILMVTGDYSTYEDAEAESKHVVQEFRNFKKRS